MTNHDAHVLRENTGTSGLAETARLAAETLAYWDIPHLIVGGLAVQEHGYPRVTLGVDIVVPDILDALEHLTADITGPFVRLPGIENRVKDSRNGVLIDLLPAGRVLKRGCQVPFPEPKVVSETPRIVSLEDLISLKLDSWANTPMKRLKDKSDVIELMKSKSLPRDLAVCPAVQQLYQETWDALQAET
ncbi:MAG: hypothetical protein EXS30_04495 [Pedosphaera sp.]|nr:hypothetical protein [Pedosphaera sp.]